MNFEFQVVKASPLSFQYSINSLRYFKADSLLISDKLRISNTSSSGYQFSSIVCGNFFSELISFTHSLLKKSMKALFQLFFFCPLSIQYNLNSFNFRLQKFSGISVIFMISKVSFAGYQSLSNLFDERFLDGFTAE